MSALRSILHGLALTLADIFAVVGGFALWKACPVLPQRIMQIPASTLLTVTLFLVWTRASRLTLPAWTLRGRPEYARTYNAALVWNPLLFSFLHYATQGYLTDAGNIFALAWFQLPVNFIALQAALHTGRG